MSPTTIVARLALSIFLAAAAAVGPDDPAVIAGPTGMQPAAPEAGPDAPPDPLAAGWNGSPVCELLAETERLRALRCTFPPGVGHERHRHVPHFGYALSGGRMQIRDGRGTREVELATGSSFTSEGGDHEVLNVGATTVVYLIVEPK